MSGKTPKADEMRRIFQDKMRDLMVKSTEELKVAFRETVLKLPEVEGEEEKKQIEELKRVSGEAVADSIELSPTRKEGSQLKADITINEGAQVQVLRVWGDQDPLIRWKNRLGRSQ